MCVCVLVVMCVYVVCDVFCDDVWVVVVVVVIWVLCAFSHDCMLLVMRCDVGWFVVVCVFVCVCVCWCCLMCVMCL